MLTGYTEQQWLDGDITFQALVLPECYEHYLQVVKDALHQRQPYSVEYQIRKLDGEACWVWEQGHGIFDGDLLLSIEGYITDISSQKDRESFLQTQLQSNQQLLEEYKGVVDVSAIVSKTDSSGVITYVNEQFCQVSGYSSEELVGSTHSIVKHPDTQSEVFQELWQTIRSGKTWRGTLCNRTKQGRDYFVSSVISPIIDAQGEVVEFISVRFDVTDLIEKERRIRRQTTDQLTLLPNRQQLLEDLALVKSGALAIVNINDFKLVNEYYGFELGDQLLRDMGVSLSRLVTRHQLRLYRLSGDEFALFRFCSEGNVSFDELCDLITNHVSETTFEVAGIEFALSVTVGGASGAATNLLMHADIALHSAKEQHLAVQIYDVDSTLKRQIDNNITWLKRIRSAIQEDRIEVFAQPILSVGEPDKGRYECLMRLREGDVYHSPYLFLQAAKNGRLYGELTRIVVTKSCEFFAERTESFSLNITASDIQNPETSAFILNEIKRWGVGDRLVFELVESEGIEESELTLQFFDQVRALGCGLAIDDFGTGYSNFEYLLKLNIDFIKIDGSLIRYIDSDANARIVAETVVDFAKRLGVKTVAEFVHSDAVEQEARRIGIDYLQGYLLGEPVALNKL